MAGLSARARVLSAVEVAVAEVRTDPLDRLLVDASGTSALIASGTVTDFAKDLAGLVDDDPDAANWIVRVLLSLLFWPATDSATERRLLERFLAPAFGHQST